MKAVTESWTPATALVCCPTDTTGTETCTATGTIQPLLPPGEWATGSRQETTIKAHQVRRSHCIDSVFRPSKEASAEISRHAWKGDVLLEKVV